MQTGQIGFVRTDSATQFTAALAQNAALTVDLTMPMGGAPTPNGDGYVDAGLGAGGTVKARLRSITIVSVENLDWEIWLWATAAFNASLTDPNAGIPTGRWSFAAANAVQIAAAGLYYYYIDGLDVAYVDLAPRSGQLHLMLVNRSAGGKTAGAGGAIMIQLGLENAYGY